MKKVWVLLLVCFLVATPVAAADVERNETVYATLDNHGEALQVRVVTWLRGSIDQDTWTDFGGYDSVESSVSDLAPGIGEGTITWPGSALAGEGLFYQGMTERDLPIDLQIDYYLDGNLIEPEELAGASGQVTIKLQLVNRLSQQVDLSYLDYEQKQRHSQQVIYTPLVVQITQALPVGTWSDIVATGANRVLVGDQLRLSWALFPYPDAEAVVTMQGQKICLAPLEISVLPMMPPLPDLDTASQVKQLAAGVDQLAESLGQLSSAASTLASGQSQVTGGGQQLTAGAAQLAEALQSAVVGAQSLATGLVQLQTSHQQLAKSSWLLQQTGDPYLQSIASGLLAEEQALTQLVGGSQSLAAGLSQTADAMSGISTQAGGLFAAAGQIAAGQQALADGLQVLLSQGLAPMREQAVGQYAQVQAGLATTRAMEQLVQGQHSFIDNANNHIGRVQYLLRTTGVKRPAASRPTTGEAASPLSIWQRIVRFFTGR